MYKTEIIMNTISIVSLMVTIIGVIISIGIAKKQNKFKIDKIKNDLIFLMKNWLLTNTIEINDLSNNTVTRYYGVIEKDDTIKFFNGLYTYYGEYKTYFSKELIIDFDRCFIYYKRWQVDNDKNNDSMSLELYETIFKIFIGIRDEGITYKNNKILFEIDKHGEYTIISLGSKYIDDKKFINELKPNLK